MEALDRAIKAADGVGALAKLINVGQSVVSNWRARGSVPPEHCAAIEIATDKKVTRRDLRPDDWHRIWPELLDGGDTPPSERQAAIAQS